MLCHMSRTISTRTENEHCRTTKKHSVTQFPPWSALLAATNRGLEVKCKKVSWADQETTPVRKRQACSDNSPTSLLPPLKLDMSSTSTTSFSALGTNIVAGSQIVCLWDQNTYYPGVVTKIHSCTPDSYDVQFNDGDTQCKVALSNILDLTLYMGSVTTHQEQQGTNVPGVICAIRPLLTNLKGMAWYDPQHYEYGISETRGKKKICFQSFDCITTKPTKVPLFQRTNNIAKKAPTVVSKLLEPNTASTKTASHHTQHTLKGVHTTKNNDTLLLIVRGLQKVHETCKLDCAICNGFKFASLNTKDLLQWNVSALPDLKLRSKLKEGTNIRYEIQQQALTDQYTQQNHQPTNSTLATESNKHTHRTSAKSTLTEFNSNASCETKGASPQVTKYIRTLQDELRKLQQDATMKSTVRDEHENIQYFSMPESEGNDFLDRTGQEAAFQLRLNQIQQQSANSGRVKYQNMEISATIRAIHPQRKRLNGRKDFVFNGISAGNRPTRSKWIDAFLKQFEELERSPDSLDVDQPEALVLMHYNSNTTSPALTLAIQQADAEIWPIIFERQQKSAQCDSENLAKEKERKRKRSQRAGGDHKTKLESFHASLGHTEEMSLTLIADPRCKDSVRIISSHDGGAHQVYAMSQLFEQDKLFRSIVGDVAALATPTVHTQRLSFFQTNKELMSNVKSFCGKLLTAIHESAAKQLECTTKKLSKPSILKSVWPHDIYRHRETKSFFRENNRCLMCVLSVIKLLKVNKCIKLHAKPGRADSHALRTPSHISGMSEFFTSLVHASAYKIERKKSLRVPQVSEGQAQDPVATVYFDHGFANELINIVTSQDRFNEAKSWPEIKVISERDTSQHGSAGTPEGGETGEREGGGGGVEGQRGECGTEKLMLHLVSSNTKRREEEGEGGRGRGDRVSEHNADPKIGRSSMHLTEFLKFLRISDEEAVASVRICIDILDNLSKNKYFCFVLLAMDSNSYYYFVMHSGNPDIKKFLARENSSDYSPV